MKIYHNLAYLIHRLIRRIHKRPGRWQTAAFEKHNNAMRYHKSFFVVLATVLFWTFGSVQADYLTEEEQTVRASEKVVQATVKLNTVELEPGMYGHGTGFYIASDTILTNEHVIHKLPSNDVTINTYDGRSCLGKVGYREEKPDLAIIKTDCTHNNYLTFGDDAKIGRTIIAVGNPGDLDFTVSKGIISAYRFGWWQFDAKVTFGSSGGVLANLNGEVVGVVVRKSNYDQYASFAIPSDQVKKFVERSK